MGEYRGKHVKLEKSIDVFTEDADTLIDISIHIFQTAGVIKKFNIPVPILARFLFAVKASYQSNNPYHNWYVYLLDWRLFVVAPLHFALLPTSCPSEAFSSQLYFLVLTHLCCALYLFIAFFFL